MGRSYQSLLQWRTNGGQSEGQHMAPRARHANVPSIRSLKNSTVDMSISEQQEGEEDLHLP